MNTYVRRQRGITLIGLVIWAIAIAFAAQPDSGSFNDGMTMLDKMATLISGHLGELAGGHCP